MSLALIKKELVPWYYCPFCLDEVGEMYAPDLAAEFGNRCPYCAATFDLEF